MRNGTKLLGIACATWGAFVGCSSHTTSGNGGNAGTGGSGGGGSGPTPVCTEPAEVACEDQVYQGMNLQPDPAPGLITNEANGEGWYSLVDATAGGFGANPPDSFVYGKFTATGLEKVAISDEQSLASMDWDIAFRRYVIRINSGNSGPSCVTAARLPEDQPVFDSVTTVPEGLTYHADEYFTADPDCALIPDGTGMPDSPATALGGYWEYPGCVAMTLHVFVIELASGQHVKLVVTEYYWDAAAADPGAGQDECDTTGTTAPTGSANIHFRWAFLP